MLYERISTHTAQNRLKTCCICKAIVPDGIVARSGFLLSTCDAAAFLAASSVSARTLHP